MGRSIPKVGTTIPKVGRTIPFVGDREENSPVYPLIRTKHTAIPVMRPTKGIVGGLPFFSCGKVLTIPYLVRSYSCYEETYPN
jgi:hypothetical protein